MTRSAFVEALAAPASTALEAPPLSLTELAELVTRLAASTSVWGPARADLPLARGGLRLLATPTHEAWLLGWPPGSNVEPHDHGASHGAFIVLEGELDEVRWSRSGRHQRRLSLGRAQSVAQGVVHDVMAGGPVAALSIHAYSPPLRSMRFYDETASQVLAVEPIVPEPAVLAVGGAALAP